MQHSQNIFPLSNEKPHYNNTTSKLGKKKKNSVQPKKRELQALRSVKL